MVIKDESGASPKMKFEIKSKTFIILNINKYKRIRNVIICTVETKYHRSG